MSTEHTAFLRLKHGIPAPRSGSISLNSKVVAEQIGAQIFIDGWAMVAPGDPELAASLAQRAASVSHDGEAVYAAQLLAAMESLAFIEPSLDRTLDTALSFIPNNSTIFRLVSDLRNFHAKQPDWRQAFADVLLKHYGYDKFGGNCHIVPNHGVVILGILYGQDNFQKALMITNTCGWDTDCNAGNVGCFMGIRFGLHGICCHGPDWRTPIADRLYLPTADGGRCITDALTETYKIVNIGLALAHLDPLSPKNGARFHFSLPGSQQGWTIEDSPESRNTANLAAYAIASQDRSDSQPCLGIFLQELAPGRVARASTPTFIPPDAHKMPGYTLMASPTLYPGQTVTARVGLDEASSGPVSCRLYLRFYDERDQLVRLYGPDAHLRPDDIQNLIWTVPHIDGPIADIGLEIAGSPDASRGIVCLDYLTWSGCPDVVFKRSRAGGSMWLRAWVDAMDSVLTWDTIPEDFRFIKNEGRGLLSTGTREWTDYRVSAHFTPHLAKSFGLVARYQGLRRFYALLLDSDGHARLIKALDGDHTLAQMPFPWQFTNTYHLALQVQGSTIQAWIDNQLLFTATDNDRPLAGGGIALLCDQGRVATGPVLVQPPQPQSSPTAISTRSD